VNARALSTLPAETLFFSVSAMLVIVLAATASMSLPFAVQVGLLSVAVIVLGLPHGSLDAWVAGKAGLYQGGPGWVVFNLLYLALALLIVAGWWFSPVIALGLFLLISAWHFSDDWREHLSLWQRLTAAAALLGMPAVFSPEAVAAIFVTLSGSGAVMVAEALRAVGMAAMLIMVPILLRAAQRRQLAVVAELGLLVLLAIFASPLIYFLIYFCLLHSPRHLRGTLALASREERPRVLGQAVVYTLVTVALAGTLVALVLPSQALSELALRMLFIGLAALTVPHMLLMLWTARRL